MRNDIFAGQRSGNFQSYFNDSNRGSIAVLDEELGSRIYNDERI